MFEVIGVRNSVYQEKIGEPFLDHYSEETVATFDYEKDAEKFIRKSKLKKPWRQTFGSIITFKKETLLRDYEDAYVQEHLERPSIPHNPEIPA